MPTIGAVLSTLAVIAVTTGVPGLTLEEFQSDSLWLLIVGFLIAFVLAFAVGANDVANSFGTTVGAKTLTLRQACILASVFETLGAILLGAKVGETIRKGIIDPTIYVGHEKLLMVGEVSAMIGSGLWQLVATFLKLPVSGTHSIVGATVGFSLVAMGFQGVNWVKMGLIVASWFISPVLAGAMAALFYYFLRKLIFLKDDPVTPGLFAMPILYGCTVAVNFFSVFYSGAPLLGLDAIPLWGDFLIAFVLGIFAYLIVRLAVVVKMKHKIEKERDVAKPVAIPIATGPSNSSTKKTIASQVLATISEKEPLVTAEGQDDEQYGKTATNMGAGDAPVRNGGVPNRNGDVPNRNGDGPLWNKQLAKVRDSPRKISSNSNHSTSEKTSYSETNVKAKKSSKKPKTLESLTQDAKQQRRGNSRSQSLGDHIHSSAKIPAVLQLEKGVLKATKPEPTVNQLKAEIRKNFSEPSMINLTENLNGELFEVYINRQRKDVTIQRKRRTKSESNGRVMNKSESSQGDVDSLLDGVPKGPTHLEEPFDDSEDDGVGLTMKVTSSEELMVLSSGDKSYTGAIEAGFRKLSKSHQPDIIRIKVAESPEKDSEVGTAEENVEEEDKEDRMEVRRIFSFLQILTACFGAFAHGGNDVSNAIGPLIALFIIYQEGSVAQTAFTPLWLLLYGGVGICAGLWVWGRRVIKTMGEDLTSLTPSRGFTIELMSGVTVLAASNVGIPVSTTHCKVGAVVSVGWVRSRAGVDWHIFRNIVLAWFVTVPVSGGLSAIVFLFMRAAAGL